MKLLETIYSIWTIEPCNIEKFEHEIKKILSEFEFENTEDFQLVKDGPNLYKIKFDSRQIPIFYICVDTEDDVINIIDVWN